MAIPRPSQSVEFVSRSGLFVVLEGIDGSGTTTQGQLLADHLRSQRQKVVFTHEPSDGPVGMLIRLALAGRLKGPQLDIFELPDFDDSSAQEGNTIWDMETLALLYAADRMDHLSTQIVPNLRHGRSVLCDRYVLSMLAYQGLHGNGKDLKWLISISSRIITPDLTIFLRVSPEIATARMRHTRFIRDLYEDRGVLQDIDSRYMELIGMDIPIVGPVKVISGDNSTRVVFNEILRAINDLLPRESPLGRQQKELFSTD